MIATSSAVASIYALTALGISFSINAVYFLIFFIPLLVMGWGLSFIIRPILKMLKP